MKGKDNEVAHARWFADEKADWTMFEKLRAALAALAGVCNEDKDGGFFICQEAAGEVKAAFDLLEDLSIQENLRKRDFLCVATYEALALIRERNGAACVFTPQELRGAKASRVEDRLVEFGWEVIDGLAAFPHSVACRHCGHEFESTEADYDETLAGTALICPNCGGYVVGNPDEQDDSEEG